MSKKFDVVIGNPPYQEKNEDSKRDESIYPYFYDGAKDIATKYSLITPARFLFNIGATSKKWNQEMLDDEHLKVIYYNQDSSAVFSNTDIMGGVVIMYRDNDRDFGKIETFTAFEELDQILLKVTNPSFKSLSDILYGNSCYKLKDQVYLDYPELIERVSKSEMRAVGSNAFDRFPELFTCDKIDGDEVSIYGRQNNQRQYKYIKQKYIIDGGNMGGFKVFVPGANGSGAIGEIIPTPIIGHPVVGNPNTGHTQTFISIGNFDTKLEAEYLLKYLKGKFSRAMLGIKKVTQNNKTKETWEKVPLQDLTEDSDIDWSQSISDIDKQLYKKYNLNEDEIEFIETNVKEMS